MGTTALVSRRIWEKKPGEAAVAAVQAIFTGLVLRGEFGDPVPVYSAFLAAAVIQRVVANPAVQAGLAVFNWLLIAALIGLYAMKLGGAVPTG